MAQLPFIVGGSGLTIGNSATAGNIQFNNNIGNFIIGNATTGRGYLLVRSNNSSNSTYAVSVAGGASIQGNLYVNGAFGLRASMSNAATISPGDIFFSILSGGGAWVPVGTVVTQSGGQPINVSTGAGTSTPVPNGTYRCLGLFQTGQYRGVFVRLS
jgi:hypothetical protein